MIGYSVISTKGQVTIPSALRKKLGLKPSHKVAITQTNNQVIISPVKSINNLKGSITPKNKPEDFKKMRKNFHKYLSTRKK